MDDSFVLPYRVGFEAGETADSYEPLSSFESVPHQSQTTPSRSRLDQQKLLELKPVIRRLYIDEGLTFGEVANILKTDFNFIITKRQFSSLQNKWGWKKNTRTPDRQKIMDKLKHEKGSISLEGYVGTVLLNVEKLNRWRKEFESKAASVQGNEIEEHQQESQQSQQHEVRQKDLRHNRITELARQPSPPRVFQASEYLASNIKNYVAGMFDQGTWDLSDRQPKNHVIAGGQHETYILDEFLGSAIAAMNLILKGSYVEARRMFTIACDLVRKIIEEQDILILSYVTGLFSTFRSKRNESLFEVLNLLRTFIAKMAAEILPRDHPLRIIFYLLGYMDLEQFDEKLLFSIDVTASLMAAKLGLLHRKALTVRRNYIRFRQEIALKQGRPVHQGARDAENDLRMLLRDCDNQPRQKGTSPGHFVVLRALAGVLRLQDRSLEAEIVSLEIVNRAQAQGDQLEEIGGLNSVALCQYEQGKNSLAELNQRRAADLNLQRNDSDSLVWAIAHLTRLEEWMREWGRPVDADNLHAEIGVLILRNNNGKEEEQIEM